MQNPYISNLLLAKARRARIWVARAWGETHNHRGFPSMNSGLERFSEFGIEVEGGPHSVLVIDVFVEVMDLVTILAAQLKLHLLSEHLAYAGLEYPIDVSVPEFIQRLLPL